MTGKGPFVVEAWARLENLGWAYAHPWPPSNGASVCNHSEQMGFQKLGVNYVKKYVCEEKFQLLDLGIGSNC